MKHKNWVDTIFGFGQTPPQPEGMDDKDYLDMLFRGHRQDQKERNKAGNFIIFGAILGVLFLTVLLFIGLS